MKQLYQPSQGHYIDSVSHSLTLFWPSRAKGSCGSTIRDQLADAHCYATHLLEAGVNPRVVQRYMGHSNLETTMAYFHLTKKGVEDSYQIINHVMKGPDCE